jgi:leucyl aminopeptidase
LKTAWADKRNQQFVDAGSKRQLLVMLEDGTDNASLEKIRKAGAEAVAHLQKSKIKSAFIHAQGLEAAKVFAFTEGALLASYRFEKYKSKPAGGIDEIILEAGSLSESEIQRLNILSESVALTRDLVNEPASVLTAPLLSEIFKETGEFAGFEVEVLEENKIQALKMGGLLGVNQGSDIPPTFNILQYKSPEAKNAKPIVLVGKGVVYDTGGHSLKTSAGIGSCACGTGRGGGSVRA